MYCTYFKCFFLYCFSFLLYIRFILVLRFNNINRKYEFHGFKQNVTTIAFLDISIKSSSDQWEPKQNNLHEPRRSITAQIFKQCQIHQLNHSMLTTSFSRERHVVKIREMNLLSKEAVYILLCDFRNKFVIGRA